MSQRQITITDADYERLQEVLASEFVQVIGPSEYLDNLRTELQDAKIVTAKEMPLNVVTMNSKVALRDLVSNELQTYTLVFPDDADIARGRLSVLAPGGMAILGQRSGNELKWRVAGGWRRLKIERMLFQSERPRANAGEHLSPSLSFFCAAFFGEPAKR